MKNLIAVTIGDIDGIGIHLLVKEWVKGNLKNFILITNFKILYNSKIIDKNQINLINSKNDLQLVVEKKHPIIRELLIDIRKIKGCYFSRMTGSGSVCYGLFTNKIKAKKALNNLKIKYPKFWSAIAKTV